MRSFGKVPALVQKIQTLVDGGFRVTLDFTAQESPIVSELITLKGRGEDCVDLEFFEQERDSHFLDDPSSL